MFERIHQSQKRRVTRSVSLSKWLCLLIGIHSLALAQGLSQDVVSGIETEPTRTFGLGTLNAIAVSPNGEFMVTGGSRGAFLWEISSGTVIRTFEGDTHWVTSVAFSPDGQSILTGSYDSTVKLWPVGQNTESGAVTIVEATMDTADGSAVMSFELAGGTPGEVWLVQRASSISGEWTEVGNVEIDSEGLGQFEDLTVPAGAAFYRLSH